MKAYVVTISMPGYLPMDDEPATFSTRRAAESYAVQEAREIRESCFEFGDDKPHADDIYRKSGSARDGAIWLERTNGPAPRLVVEIHELTGDAAEEALTTFDD